jgi:hypothetical protein
VEVTVPGKLYHAAPECVLGKILTEGLKSRFGIYAAESPGEALAFMWFRLLDHAHIDSVNGTPVMNVERHDVIHVWEIDTSKTELAEWEEGTDHSARFFGNASSWVYLEDSIPTTAISCQVFTREVVEEALAAVK